MDAGNAARNVARTALGNAAWSAPRSATGRAAWALAAAALALALLLIPNSAFASQAAQDGMTLELTTDKAEYVAGDTITGKATFTNGNGFAVSEAGLSIDLPEEIEFTTTEAPVSVASIGPGESLEIGFQAKLPVAAAPGGDADATNGGGGLAKTADPTAFLAIGLIGLAILAAIVAVALRKKGKGGFGTLSVLLAALLVAPAFAAGGSVQASAAPSGVSTAESVKVLGKDFALGATGVYVLPSQAFDVSFSKVDDATDQPLAGAVFSLQDQSGGAVLTATSTDAGLVVFAGVGYGTYDLQETQEPAGYQPDPTVHVVEVGASGVIIDGAPMAEFSVRNAKMEKSAPPTFETIVEGDQVVFGNGVPGSTVAITWPNGSKTNTTVSFDSRWYAQPPGPMQLREGQVVYATQTEPGKLESDPASTVVTRRF